MANLTNYSIYVVPSGETTIEWTKKMRVIYFDVESLYLYFVVYHSDGEELSCRSLQYNSILDKPILVCTIQLPFDGMYEAVMHNGRIRPEYVRYVYVGLSCDCLPLVKAIYNNILDNAIYADDLLYVLASASTMVFPYLTEYIRYAILVDKPLTNPPM